MHRGDCKATLHCTKTGRRRNALGREQNSIAFALDAQGLHIVTSRLLSQTTRRMGRARHGRLSPIQARIFPYPNISVGEEMRKNKQPTVVFAKKPAVVATQVALAVMAQLAYAQQPVQTAERVERVEITGSRIPTVEAEGPSPITVMTQQEIRTDGLSKTEDLLNTLPQVYAAQGSNASNGATGTAQVNLRGLGPTRNLVLLNGRRLPPGSPATGGYTAYAADLNQIPAPLIQRVEVLTGGASAVYGSDAISGVINFIMNDRFEGLQVDFYHSFYNHQQQNPDGIGDIIRGRSTTNASQFHAPGDVTADGKVNGISILMGRNFADNKGNATLFLGYKKEDPLTEAQRDFSACALNSGH